MAVRKLLTDGVYVDVGCGGGEARAERRRQRARPGVAGCGGGGAVAETVRAACGAAPKRLSGEATLPRARSGRLSANLPPLPRAPRSGSRYSYFFFKFRSNFLTS